MQMKYNVYRKLGKRIFDLVLLVPGLIVCLPLLGCIAILVYLKLGSPIFFRQIRPGLNGNSFSIVKFRTMLDSRDHSNNLLPNEKRLTPFGLRLRSTSLDELPELFNVLKGDMSFVGPRPLLMEYLDKYTPRQKRRHEVKPGITGWAQVNGRNAITWDQKFEYDVWYVENHSFFLDIRILLLTLWKVLTRQGISPKDKVIVDRFTGSKDSTTL
jgi:sugar transferase EpsL